MRTHEISRRLVAEFEITIVCARYPGARRRVQDGVRYVHVGLPLGYFGSLLSYFAALPWALWRYDSDLVVEDFGAPFSSVAIGYLTRRPVLGVAQWLFASDKARQYHLPFHVVEQIGLRSHRRIIAVSEDMAEAVRARNPMATVSVIPAGYRTKPSRTGPVLATTSSTSGASRCIRRVSTCFLRPLRK